MLIAFLIATVCSVLSMIYGYHWGNKDGFQKCAPFIKAVEMGCLSMLRAASILERDDVSPNEANVAHDAIIKALTEIQQNVPKH